MKSSTIERYLDECGITPGPWEYYGHEEVEYVLGENGKYELVEGYSSGWDDLNVIAQAREMLKALIRITCKFEKYEWVCEHERHIIESAFPGRTWPEIKARLEEIEEEER